ncbi:MAG: hypothetical protein NVSMB42_11320 [Herpetosiphon sp.]
MFVLGAFAVGFAINVRDQEPLLWISGALALASVGIMGITHPLLERWSAALTMPVLGGAIATQMLLLLERIPAHEVLLARPAFYGPFEAHTRMALVVATLLAGVGLGCSRAGLRRHMLILMVMVAGLLGAWIVAHAATRHIDVYLFQADSATSLLHGINPYNLMFPDFYSPLGLPFYGPGLSVNNWLQFGYPYPPASLFFDLAGTVVGGDFRYAQLGSILLAAGCLAFARPSNVAFGAAALLLWTPRVLHMLEQGWTEPFVVVVLAMTVFCAWRFPRALPWMLGLLVVVKQYMIFTVPLAWLLVPRPVQRRQVWEYAWKAALAAAIINVPFLLWNPPAFLRAVVWVQFQQPFRLDSTSYVAWLARHGGTRLPTAVAFVAMLPGLGLALWRAPRTPAGFAGSIGVIYTCFLLFNKQAFGNYYLLVIGALCCAAAVSQAGTVSAAMKLSTLQDAGNGPPDGRTSILRAFFRLISAVL